MWRILVQVRGRAVRKLIEQTQRNLVATLRVGQRQQHRILSLIHISEPTRLRRISYAVLGRRPAISKARKLALVARAAMGKLL